MDTKYIVIIVMCASKKEALAVVDSLLKKRLVACANIISGVESKFWWKGKINNAKETFVMMKTLGVNLKKIEKVIKEVHSYEVPEIIAVPIIFGSKDYLSWIKGSIK